jgi:septal ring factor EnvC (AmiA/AmiB activator)
LLQAVILLAILVAMRKLAKSIREESESLRTSLMPVVYDSRDFLAATQATLASTQEFLTTAQGVLARVSPKVDAISTDLVQITQTLRKQTAEMQTSATEIMERVRKQSDRLDSMITHFLDSVDRAGIFVADAVGKPVRQISRSLASVKAIVDTLRMPPPPRR